MAVTASSTGMRLRRVIDAGDNWGWLDPIYGLPEDACPVVLDSETNLLRPFSSMVTPATAVTLFYGWAVGYKKPRATTDIQSVQVIRRAIVELDVPTPAALKIDDRMKPVTETVNAVTFVSNFNVVVDNTAANSIYKVVKLCNCSWYPAQACPPAAAAPADDPTDTAATFPTVRKVWAEFNVTYRSKA